MAKGRRTGIWHITVDTGVRRVTLLCGPTLGPQHFHASREVFEKMPQRGRCVACETALNEYKARLLAA